MSGALAAPSNPVVFEAGLLSRAAAFANAGNGSTDYLVTAAVNVAGLYLWTAVLSSGAFGTATNQWQATDEITDDNGVIYHAVQIGMPAGTPVAVVVAPPIDLKGIFVPPSVGVKLVNGGEGAGNSVLRQCSATLIYTLLNDPANQP